MPIKHSHWKKYYNNNLAAYNIHNYLLIKNFKIKPKM